MHFYLTVADFGRGSGSGDFKNTPEHTGYVFSGEARVKHNHHPLDKPEAGKKLCFSSPRYLSTTRWRWTDGQDNNSFCLPVELQPKLSLPVSGKVWICWVNQTPSQIKQKFCHFPVYKHITVGLGHPTAQHTTLLSIHWDLCWAAQPPEPNNRDSTLKTCPRKLHLRSV